MSGKTSRGIKQFFLERDKEEVAREQKANHEANLEKLEEKRTAVEEAIPRASVMLGSVKVAPENPLSCSKSCSNRCSALNAYFLMIHLQL